MSCQLPDSSFFSGSPRSRKASWGDYFSGSPRSRRLFGVIIGVIAYIPGYSRI